MNGAAPEFHDLEEPVRDVLRREYGLAAKSIMVIRGSDRSYSKIWTLRIDAADTRALYILKWLPIGAVRERDLSRLSADIFCDGSANVHPAPRQCSSGVSLPPIISD